MELTVCLCREALGERFDHLLQLAFQLLAERALLFNLREEVGLAALEVGQEVGLPLQDLVDWHLVKVTIDTCEDERHHLVDSHGRVLLLLQKFHETFTTVQGLLGRGVEIGAELSKRSDFTVLGQEELERSSDLLHRLELRSRADTRHRQADVDGWADTLVEQLGFQEDLTVGDGNDVGGNVGRHITALCLDNRERGQRTTAVLVVHLGSALKETRVQIEDTIAYQYKFETGARARLTLRGRPHAQEDDGAAATSDGMQRLVWTDRRRQ